MSVKKSVYSCITIALLFLSVIYAHDEIWPIYSKDRGQIFYLAQSKDKSTKKLSNLGNPLIGKDEFLKQFIGKSFKDSFGLKKDYEPISNAPKASVAVAKAAQKAFEITSQVFEKKVGFG